MIYQNGSLCLSEKAMVVAVQEYLEKRVKEGFVPNVVSIEVTKANGYGAAQEFTIKLSERTPEG